MRNWFTAFLLVAAMVGSAIGAGAHGGEGSMANMPDCCKKAQSASNTPGISMARLCCNLNCSEPGSGGSSSSSSFSAQQSITLNGAVIPSAAPFSNVAPLGRYSGSSHLHDSNPKYIQHLALLI
jgi:hypothetical protein